ncbi:MAG: tetratricopeptide repeat protein, partial [Cyanobacteriota bacterium]
YGEAEPLYRRSLAILEKALSPEHPDTIKVLNNLATMYLAISKAAAAELLLQRLNLAQANWLRRELALQPRELRGSLINKQPDTIATTFALLDQHPAAAPLALDTRLNHQGLLVSSPTSSCVTFGLVRASRCCTQQGLRTRHPSKDSWRVYGTAH